MSAGHRPPPAISSPYILRSNREMRVLIHQDWEGDLSDTLLSRVGKMERDPNWEVVPTCPGSLVFRIKRMRGDLYLKYFRPSGWVDRAKSLVRGTKAQRAWRGGGLLRRHGFRTPPLIALGEGSSCFGSSLGFLLTEAVQGPRLKQILKAGFQDWLAERGWRKGPFLRMLARTIADLHGKGIYHGDLNPTNILVDPEGDLSPSTFCFLDNARCRFMRRVPYGLRVRDLSGLNNPRLGSITMRDRLRFFLIYEKHLGVRDPKGMAREIWKRSSRPRKRNRGGQ